jgi:rod shape-determining protein MreD
MPGFIKYILFLIIALIIQKTFIWVIAVTNYNITPDLVLIILVYISIKEGKLFGIIAGFSSGLIIDLLAGSFLGLLALSYTITCFIIGNFKDENEKYLRNINFILITGLASLITNFLYFEIFFQSAASSISIIEVVYRYILPSVLYTMLISVFYLFKPGTKSTQKVY